MQEKVVPKEAMPGFLQRLIGTAKTIAPVRQPSGHYLLKPVARADEVALDFPFLYYSAKEYLLPPGEPVLQFGRREGKPFVTPVTDTEEVILFGLHPCDLNAVWTYDAFFTADHKDDNFLARRRHMTIVGLDCAKPCDEYSFCADMKTDVAQGGYDVLLTDIGDAYFARAATERGEKLLADAPAADRQAAGRAGGPRESPAAAVPEAHRVRHRRTAQAPRSQLRQPRLDRRRQALLQLRLVRARLPDLLLLRPEGPPRRSTSPTGSASAGGTAACSTPSRKSPAARTSGASGTSACATGCSAKASTSRSRSAAPAASAAAGATAPAPRKSPSSPPTIN